MPTRTSFPLCGAPHSVHACKSMVSPALQGVAITASSRVHLCLCKFQGPRAASKITKCVNKEHDAQSCRQ